MKKCPDIRRVSLLRDGYVLLSWTSRSNCVSVKTSLSTFGMITLLSGITITRLQSASMQWQLYHLIDN